MEYNSKAVESAQTTLHPALEQTVRKHLEHPYRKPVQEHNRRAFLDADCFLQRRGAPLVLDAGCGTGESTRRLALWFPEASVVGVDKSAHRLAKADSAETADNMLLVRADLADFWRLAVEAGWKAERQFILYPNPWPRPEHFMRRWHGHPVFGCIVALGGALELRSNWSIYVEEWAAACALAAGVHAETELLYPQDYLTPFERKYALSGQTLYRYRTVLEST